MSIYTALGEALQALLAGGFVGSAASYDLYSSWKTDKANRCCTPFIERIISAVAADLLMLN